jgi:hypothetical protein
MVRFCVTEELLAEDFTTMLTILEIRKKHWILSQNWSLPYTPEGCE